MEFANKLILGDNLEKLKGFESDSIDLIYLDPPFFSNRSYEVIWGDDGEVRSFQDRWAGGIEHYIAWLKERVEEMHRILKPTGSIFLHCDWHANAYIRVGILDRIFEIENFKGEIIWQRTNSHNDAKKKIAVLTDTIWYYSKSDIFIYNPVLSSLSEKYTDDFYKYNDRDGKGLYRLDNMASPNPRPNMMYEWRGFSCPAKGWRYEKKSMQKLHDEERIYYPKDKNGNYDFSKRLALKRYLTEQQGQLLGNLWTDIQNVQSQSKERIGYPTQKPEALMERLINMASNEGDIVLDPFVGGGTTVVVADKLNRKWIGIDQSVAAIRVSDLRLKKLHSGNLYAKPYELQLRTYDYNVLRNMDAFAFESMIIEQLGGIANPKQRNDYGIDGKMPDHTPIQVKRSDNIGRSVIDNFLSAVQRSDEQLFEKNKAEGKAVGFIIAFSFGRGAVEEVARLKNKKQIFIELKKVSDIIPLGNSPKVSLTAEEIERSKFAFEATAESESEISFYSWDFNHKPEDGLKTDVYLNKEGKQVRIPTRRTSDCRRNSRQIGIRRA